MIRVTPQPSPADFAQKVRLPGLRALAELRGDPAVLSMLPSRPGPRRRPVAEITVEHLPPLWRECLPDLYRAYHGICAYLAIRIPKAVGSRTVDHYGAKVACVSGALDQVYEWSSYRLACSLMNARKQAFDDVLDPFKIEDGWFHLEFSGLQVLPDVALPQDLQAAIRLTIERLGLNDRECCEARAELYDAYISGDVTLTYLDRSSPFVAKEGLARTLT